MKMEIYLDWKISKENQNILETMLYFKNFRNLIARELPQYVKPGMWVSVFLIQVMQKYSAEI